MTAWDSDYKLYLDSQNVFRKIFEYKASLNISPQEPKDHVDKSGTVKNVMCSVIKAGTLLK